MPHIVVELTERLRDRNVGAPLLHDIHRAAAATGIVSAADLKLRVVVVGDHLVGGVVTDFVHATMSLLAGRDDDGKLRLSRDILDCLARHFPDVDRLSVDIRDMDAAAYKKRPLPAPGR